MELQKKRVLIVGGYGVVGSSIARLISKNYSSVELILAGRNPEKGEALVKELHHAKTAYADLEKGFDLAAYGHLDLIITSMGDPRNIIRETAIANGIALIHIAEVIEDISPAVFLALHQELSAPVVFAGHWQAGIITLVTKQLAAGFNEISTVEAAGLYDEKDHVGPMVTNEVGGFIAKALLREQGKWQYVEAKENGRTIQLADESSFEGFPMSSLDVPSIGALTGAPNIRFDFATGESIGSRNGRAASHDLYIDIEGFDLSGESTKLRTIVSDPQGVAHLTAVGTLLILEGIFGYGGQTAAEKGGLYSPETIVSTAHIMSRLEEFGIAVTQETL